MDAGHIATDKMLSDLEKRISDEYSKAAVEMDEKLTAFLSKYEDKRKIMLEKVKNGDMKQSEYRKWRQRQVLRSDQWRDMRDSLVADSMNAKAIASDLINGVTPSVYAVNMNYATYEIESNLKISTSFALYDHRTVERLLLQKSGMIPAAPEGTPKDELWNRQKITSAITQGVLQGESIPKIAKRLRAVTNMDKKASIRNARTYCTAAQNAGRLDGYKRAQDMGIKLQKEWMATSDGRTRESHVDADGMVVDIDKPFELAGGDLMYPGDAGGPPEEVYNCRCTMVASFPKDGSLFKEGAFKAGGKGDFDEWMDGLDRPFDSYEWEDSLFNNDLAVCRDWTDEWLERVTGAERSGVEEYTGSSYISMNKYLRGLRDSARGHEQDIVNCTDALQKAVLPQDVIVQRGDDASMLPIILQRSDALDALDSSTDWAIGAIFNDKGFLSTTPDTSGGFEGDLRYVIKLPKGTHAAYVDPISQHRGELEMLVQRNSFFRVEQIDVGENRLGEKSYTVYMTLIGQGKL